MEKLINSVRGYAKSRRKTIEASIEAERLGGNSVKELNERTALAEITALEYFIALQSPNKAER